MPMWRRFPAALAVLGPLLGATGCPGLLDDGFREVNARKDGGATFPKDGGHAGAGNAAGGNGGADATLQGSGGGPSSSGGKPSLDASPPDGAPSTDGGPCSRCRPSETCCDGECVNLDRDPRHCRTCGMGCPGTVCDNATCTNECAFGFIDCNRNVADGCEVNAAQDPAHCGNCTTACGFQQTCDQGVCHCSAQTVDCDGDPSNGCEVDIGSNLANCGQCHRVCGANAACAGGKCGCAVGFADCNGDPSDGCEASLTNSTSCGSCNLDCGQHSVCLSAGVCGCAAGYQDCDAKVGGCETPTDDPLHCSACGVSCLPTTPACNGTGCVVGCGALTLCGGSCVSTTADPRNCGACNRAVGPNQICVGGKPACATGFANCDSNPLDCEVDTRTDPAHCGTCAGICKPGAVCTNGSCACSPATPQDCGTACKGCCVDAQCSDGNSCTTDQCTAGKCGFSTECAGGGHCCAGQGCYDCCTDLDCGAKAGTVCSGNQCVAPTCSLPRILCGSVCVDTTTDPGNCNGCGNACGAARTCAAHQCTPSWVLMAPPPVAFVARSKSAYAAFGSKVFIWGGSNAAGQALGDGASYDTANDTWSVLGGSGAPSARVLATAVWTGTYMVVWGGGDAGGKTNFANGARFNPVTGAWLAMSTGQGGGGPGPSGAPTARLGADGFWTGSRVLFWGGTDPKGLPLSGIDLYDPENDAWTRGATQNGPPPLLNATVGFTGSLLLLAGGEPDGKGASHQTYTYSVPNDAWTRGADGPSDRYGALGTWDGTGLLSWSGSTFHTDGERYSPDAWSSVSVVGSPTGRVALHRETGWSARMSDGLTLVVGGYGPGLVPLFDGGLYSSVTNSWNAVSAWPSATAHVFGVGVLAGSEFVLWGGRTGATAQSGLTLNGERFRP